MSLLLVTTAILAWAAPQTFSTFGGVSSGTTAGALASGSAIVSSSSPCTRFEHAIDDGSSENALGVAPGGGLLYMNGFTAIGDDDVITNISVAIGYAPEPMSPGVPIQVAIWDDPTNDFDPSDAVLLWSQTTTSSNENSDSFNDYAVPSVAVNGVFFVGVMGFGHPDELIAPIDTHGGALGRAWYCVNVAASGGYAGFDMGVLTNNSIPPQSLDAFSFRAFLVRADGESD